MAQHITHDPIYNAVDPDDFAAMIEVDRYADRTDAFDDIISSTVDHFWDPTDPSYLDFNQAGRPNSSQKEAKCNSHKSLSPNKKPRKPYDLRG